MGDKFKIHLGGRDRALHYTLEDRENIEAAFPRPSGTPNSLFELMGNNLLNPAGSFSVQTMILWAGLHRVENKINLLHVKTWLEEAIKAKVNVAAMWMTAANAIMESGVLGVSAEIKTLEEAEGAGGEDPKDKTSLPL